MAASARLALPLPAGRGPCLLAARPCLVASAHCPVAVALFSSQLIASACCPVVLPAAGAVQDSRSLGKSRLGPDTRGARVGESTVDPVK